MSEVMELSLLPAKDIHLYSGKSDNMLPGGDIDVVVSFSLIAVLILIIATINYINLAIARSSRRAREISIRKVVGATKGQLTLQFLGESVLMSLMGLVLAFGLVELVLPFYNGFIQSDLSLSLLDNPAQTAGLVAFAVLVGIIGGIYPAFLLSGYRPGIILRSSRFAPHGNHQSCRQRHAGPATRGGKVGLTPPRRANLFTPATREEISR